MTNLDSIFEDGNGNPLQYSCLENPMDGGAWWAAVCGVTQSRTRQSGLAAAVLLKHPARVKAGSLKCTVLCN